MFEKSLQGCSAVSLLVVLLAVTLGGCNSAPVRDPEFANVRPRPPRAPEPSPGAIYRAGYGLDLFRDLRARHVGDLLTINLQESTDASKSADTTITKDNTTSVTSPTVLGSAVEFSTPGLLPLATHQGNNLGASLGSSHDFAGSGESNQSNSLTGDITVSVAEVLPNGDLVVQGEKLITLTRGNEYVRFSGVVRQADVSSDNTVPSTRVADARVVYTGDGQAADANVVGWLARFFASAIFPF